MIMTKSYKVHESQLQRFQTVAYSQDVPVRHIREMASELLSLRQQIAQMQAPAVEPAQAEQSEESGDLMWATATMRDRERNRIGKIVDGLEQIKQEKLTAIKAADDEPAQAVPEGYRLQSIAELDAMNEWIYSNDDLTIAYMSGRNDQKAVDHYNKQKALDFVRWIAQLKTGGLIQARANDILRILEKWK